MEENNTATKTLPELWAALQDVQTQITIAVAQARAGGQSWSQIGSQLGITKQAAQQRYGNVQAIKAPMEVDGQTSIKINAAPAAKPSRKVATKAPAQVRNPQGQLVDYATDTRPTFHLNSAGRVDGVAQPGTGKGPHACPRCGCTNHKGLDDQVRAYFDCTPTKYDPQDITEYLNITGLKEKAK